MSHLKVINSIELFGNAFVVSLQNGEKLTYRIGKRANIWLKRQPAGLLWTEPVARYDAISNTSILENYLIRSEKQGKQKQGF